MDAKTHAETVGHDVDVNVNVYTWQEFEIKEGDEQISKAPSQMIWEALQV